MDSAEDSISGSRGRQGHMDWMALGMCNTSLHSNVVYGYKDISVQKYRQISSLHTLATLILVRGHSIRWRRSAGAISSKSPIRKLTNNTSLHFTIGDRKRFRITAAKFSVSPEWPRTYRIGAIGCTCTLWPTCGSILTLVLPRRIHKPTKIRPQSSQLSYMEMMKLVIVVDLVLFQALAGSFSCLGITSRPFRQPHA